MINRKHLYLYINIDDLDLGFLRLKSNAKKCSFIAAQMYKNKKIKIKIFKR